MKDRNFELELADGTVLQIGAITNNRFPDVKAFYLPEGSMSPFNAQKLPTARREQPSERAMSPSGSS